MSEDNLWYPDDSGQWREYDGTNPPMEGETVNILLRCERDFADDVDFLSVAAEIDFNEPYPATALDWHVKPTRHCRGTDIVAYRIVA